MEPDRAAAREVTLDFYLFRMDGSLARHADPASAEPVPGHVAVLFRECAGTDLPPDLPQDIVGLDHGGLSVAHLVDDAPCGNFMCVADGAPPARMRSATGFGGFGGGACGGWSHAAAVNSSPASTGQCDSHGHFPFGPRGSTVSLTDVMIPGDLIR
jgi:hypothetical protein